MPVFADTSGMPLPRHPTTCVLGRLDPRHDVYVAGCLGIPRAARPIVAPERSIRFPEFGGDAMTGRSGMGIVPDNVSSVRSPYEG